MGQEEIPDVIVVGAGLAGLACAYRVAAAGFQVLVLERGDAPGSKNLSGGRLYLEPIRELCGEFLQGAPFERSVISESIVLTDEQAGVSVRLDRSAEPTPSSVTVLRARLDQHLAERVASKGAMVLCQQRVDGLLREDKRVVGVRVGSEELRARMVVGADGVLSFVAQEAGLRPERNPQNYAVGVKEIIALEATAIEQRFNLSPDHGASRLFVGQVTGGLPGGGFLYTNRDSISLGLVVGSLALQEWTGESLVWDLLEKFKTRPDVAPLLAGGTTVEYGAHLIPEGGFHNLPSLGLPGLLLVGDAAGLGINTGTMVRGMDLAMGSGALAGESIVATLTRGLGPENCLEHYQEALRKSFIMRQMRIHRKAPVVLGDSRLFREYPQLLVHSVGRLFEVNASGETLPPGKAFRGLRRELLRWRGLRNLWRLMRL